MEKKCLALFLSILMLQFSNAQSDSVEILMQPYLKKIEIADSLAFQELKIQLDNIRLDGLSINTEYTAAPTNNWQLIGRETILSLHGGISEKMQQPTTSLYQPVDKNQTFNTEFILDKFNLTKIDNRPDFVYREILSLEASSSWTAFYYKDYLIIRRQDGYIGGQISSHYTETYFFKSQLVLKTEFDNYLKNLLEQPRDTTLTLDPSFTYKYNFITQCNYHEGISTNNFYDEIFSIICIENVTKSDDLIKIVSKNFKLISKDYTRLKNETRTKLPTFWCKLDLKFRTTFEVRKTNSSIISFNNGKHLIVQDIIITEHGGRSRGVSCSYYLEKIE